ncbi:TonB-dependent siderophore receptor [Parasegetibacter sp. NRK P23]|uniref:TonB-dependent receptor plug domain-containing protein n=1 Tax=Parasegetibacter sp. NRK P23 TaxID=2942999 RepID=UPI002042D102|nr:TonB-dependent receptor [Parasegetibacter sp. NRK P23]MCM5527934.1 TonB-dependent receptor [Parasegetibacter sp. NRK P23]
MKYIHPHISPVFFLLLFALKGMAQEKEQSLDSVTVFAKTWRPTENLVDTRKIPMPVTVIGKEKIRLMGSRRLDEVLREQAGLAIVSDLGAGNRATGLQMQGFSSEYISVLLNGVPLAGRNNGNLDLSRISVADIERIEIIKGASSSLFGSEALGGVINIITRQSAVDPYISTTVLHGTYNTWDATVESATGFLQQKGNIHASGNFYRTNGFNVNPYLEKGSQTAPPYNNASFQLRAGYHFSERTELIFSGRYAGRQSEMTRNYGLSPYRDRLDEQDWNALLALNHTFNKQTRMAVKYYATTYQSKQDITLLQQGHSVSNTRFNEQVHRLELQSAWRSSNHALEGVAGAGGEYNATRTNTAGTDGNMYNYFVYAQLNGRLKPNLSWIAGARYDGNNLFGGSMNPSAAIKYEPLAWMSIRPSVGWGYRSPVYRQMYQVFTNIIRGYTVVGAHVFEEGIHTLKDAGMVQQVWPLAGKVAPLKPETSVSWNLGIELRPLATLELNINGFYNNIRNLISEQQVGVKTNGAQLFSYLNIARAYTAGTEMGFTWKPHSNLQVSGGYQLLYAKDRTILRDSIKNGNATVRDVPPRKAVPSDYIGLPNRSRHTASLQFFYTFQPWKITASLRGMYRSRAGFLDRDVNGFIDPYDVFINGYALFNASFQKELGKKLTLKLVVDNITDHTDYLMPAQPGRMILAGFSLNLSKEKHP